MDGFISRKRRRLSRPEGGIASVVQAAANDETPAEEEESTDFKLALLASLHPNLNEETLLEALLISDGSVNQASLALKQSRTVSPRKRPATSGIGYQSSLSSYRLSPQGTGSAKKPLTQKGKTLYLYTSADVEAHTPCSIIHNFLPPEEADALLLELVEQAPTYQKLEFQLFDRVVKSPHTFCFYVNSWDDAEKQKTEYIYDGRKVEVCAIYIQIFRICQY